MTPPTDETPKKQPPNPNPSPDDAGGDVPQPPRRLYVAALLGGATGGFIGAVVGSVVEAMAR